MLANLINAVFSDSLWRGEEIFLNTPEQYARANS